MMGRELCCDIPSNGFEKVEASLSRRAVKAKRDDTDPALLYPAHNLSVPIDFFHNETRYEPHTNGK